MNKQQLAAKIWASANKMRSKIEANEYKDYILGFIFYKFVSDKEEEFLLKNDIPQDEFPQIVVESDEDMVNFCKQNLGYFIAYEDLFSTWLLPGNNSFGVGGVRDALNRFERLIAPKHAKVYKGIFDTLRNGLSKLGDSAGSQTKAILALLNLIKDIPTDGSQDYDVLGFIYEYLIGNFAANAGKKAGEFYTPHEVALMMSEIVAYHLRDAESIDIYDPTSGSGSLLLNIGRSVAKHIEDKNKITYYAQELKEATFNLTRMNLVMRGILPDNIVVRNADTLKEDWPFFDENHEYSPLYCDAVVSNPPYSQNWEPTEEDKMDPRFKEYGVAPASKADYAFLLHDLFHVKPKGIMTIVLPHGVLFRGGEEETIRKKLIEHNNIDAIIGLPSNIFFGTGIPTIVMVLKQKRDRDDILIVDASRGFVKEGKNNRLRARDIKKIVDVVTGRVELKKFSCLVTRQMVRDNGYNLNIPRYVDSSDPAEQWDIYASVFGGIPDKEIATLAPYWAAFPSLREQIFDGNETPYCSLATTDITATIDANPDVHQWVNAYHVTIAPLESMLHSRLIDGWQGVKATSEEMAITEKLFSLIGETPLIDRYNAYQLFNEQWKTIVQDIEVMQTEGWDATRQIDPNMIIKKVDGKDTEVQDGFKGHIFPFDLVQTTYLPERVKEIKDLNDLISGYENELDEIIEGMTVEERDGNYLNDDNTAFVVKELKAKVNEIRSSISNSELEALTAYIALLDSKTSKQVKLDFISAHPEVQWFKMEPNKDSTYAKGKVNSYIKQIRENYSFAEDSLENRLICALRALGNIKDTKTTLKIAEEELLAQTMALIPALSDEQVRNLLHLKWIAPLFSELSRIPATVTASLVAQVKALADKYAVRLVDITKRIDDAANSLSSLLGELTGSEYDLAAVNELQSLLKE